MRQHPGCVLAALVLGMASVSHAEPAFRVIAHSDVAQTSLSREELSRLFLKKTATWKDGKPVVPVDLDAASTVRAAFSEQVHGRTVTAVKSYWQSLIFSGRGVPPAEQRSDDAVLAFVRATPGAVGYVSAGAALAGVKALSLSDVPGSDSPAPRFLEADFARKHRAAGKEPAYPRAALRNEEEGVVVARIDIAPDGRVASVAFQQTHPAFEPAVREALASWKFDPGLAGDAPAYTVVRFNFQLGQ